MRGPGFHFVEGFREAFANLYQDFAIQIIDRMTGGEADPYAMQTPGLVDGVRSLVFVEACLASSRERAWQPIEQVT
jgi:hypothetical protein